MADVEEYREIDMLVKDAKGGLNSQQTSGNIYSRFHQKEQEVRFVQSKYNDCKKIVFELQNRIERLSNQLIELKCQPHAAKQMLQATEDALRPVPSVVKPAPQLETDDPFVVDNFSQGKPQEPHHKHNIVSDGVSAMMPSLPVGNQNESKALDESCSSCQEFLMSGDMGKHTMSDELFHKVVDQNRRLKQVLQEFIDARGLSADQIRDHSQLVLLNENHASEIERLKGEVRELKRTLASSEDELKRQNAELLSKVRQSEHTAAVRKTMISHLSDHCRCLRNEVRNLLAGGSLSTEGAAKDIADIDNGQLLLKVLNDVSELQKKYSKIDEDRLSKQEAVSRLEAEVGDLKRRNRELQKVYDRSQEQVDKALKESQQWKNCCVDAEAKLAAAAVGTAAAGTRATRPCGQNVTRLKSFLPQSNLVIDAPEPEVGVERFVCQRCDRRFNDSTQYDDHVKKCED